MAEVLEVCTSDEVSNLKFMHRSGNIYIWPSNDESWEDLDSIVCSVAPPQIINEREHYIFSAVDMEKVRGLVSEKSTQFG